MTKVRNDEAVHNSLKRFYKDYVQHSLDNKMVSEFIRFHPIFMMWERLTGLIAMDHLNDVILIDFKIGEDELWKNMKKGHRYNIKKSEKEGCKVTIIESPTKAEIETFSQIYKETMNRSKAGKKYYFSNEYLIDHFKLLNTILIQVEFEGNVIGASMFMLGDNIMHYHLSGSTEIGKGIYPSNSILWEAMRFGIEKRFKYLHLGGGRGSNDNLFNFKKGFSDITYPFYIGKIIHDQKGCDELLRRNKKANAESDFFPTYRCALDDNIV